jgi:hypothetical protein
MCDLNDLGTNIYEEKKYGSLLTGQPSYLYPVEVPVVGFSEHG